MYRKVFLLVIAALFVSGRADAQTTNGNVDGDTWTWQSETRIGQQTRKGRLIIKMLSATAYNFKFELSPNGTTTWNTVLEGKDTKK
jgi:hypothetical protein